MKQQHLKPNQHFKRILMISKLIIWKISPPLTRIYQLSLKKNLFIFWTSKNQSRAMDITIITWKSPQFTKHLSLIHPKGKTQLKPRKWWVTIISSFYLSLFWSDFCKYLSISSTRFLTDKTLKYTFHLFKTTTIHPSTAPISNVKPKRV